MKKLLICASVAGSLAGLTSAAEARSLYDGSWDLVFATRRGTCDPTYNFSVYSIDSEYAVGLDNVMPITSNYASTWASDSARRNSHWRCSCR